MLRWNVRLFCKSNWIKITANRLSYALGLHGEKQFNDTGILLKMDVEKMIHFTLVVNLVSFCSLLVTFCSLLVTFCSLFDKKF